jgi:hypothetical protein
VIRKRGLTAIASAIVAGLLLVAASAAGSTVPRTARLAATATPAGVDLGAPASPAFAPVQRSFINEQLGLSPELTPSNAPAATIAKQFACVNGRQTDDPLSPPCDTSATTQNAGATYQGVTDKEIRVAIAAFGNWTFTCGGVDDACSRPDTATPSDAWVDLDKPQPSNLMFARAMKDYGDYFNSRFQTHGRRVHLFLYFMNGPDTWGEEGSYVQGKRLIDALHPFAVILESPPFSDYLAAYFARHGVAAFADLWSPPRQAEFYAQYPNRLWGQWPTIEQAADDFASYVCRKVLPNPVSISGQGDNGKPRKIGLIYGLYHDTLYSWQTAIEVQKRIKACGGDIADVGEFPNGNGCFTWDLRHTPAAEASVIARFKAEGITTVLWPSCIGTYIAEAAKAADFRPEWIALGDYEFDANGPVSASGLSPLFDGHAIMVTPATVEPPLHAKRCYTSLHSVDPRIPEYDAFWACRNYGSFRQLFTAIQRAGASLGPASMGRGLQSLPPVASDDPLVPVCSYAANDTACVKDAMAMYWDASAPTQYNGASSTGCWRVIEGGKRYLPGTWPAGNVDAQERAGDGCNDHDNDFVLGFVDVFLKYGAIYYPTPYPFPHGPDRGHVTSGIPGLPETLS